MSISPFDTIAAVSTPYGKGGVAVIRISGEDAVAIAARVFAPMNQTPLSACVPRTAVYGEITDPDDACVLDDGLAVVFHAPHSFTGEDTVEISCHGGILVTRRVLEACFMAGARQALAGEFTRRAFLNGKLELERAEALGNLLDAGSDAQMKLARAGMSGLLTDRTEGIYRDLCAVLANLEAGMDFPEEDLTELSREELRNLTGKALFEVESLIDTWRTGHAIAEGIPTVICGRPNVGKSAFYNRLVGRDAAIVTDVAGTTRDVLTDTVTLGRVTLRLSDTAGLRESDDFVERIGVERARRAMEDAELILCLSDTCPDPEADALSDALRAEGKTVIRVLTKWDLHPDAVCDVQGGVAVSSVSGDGFAALTSLVEEAFIDADLRMGEDAVVFSARQAAALRECAVALRAAVDNLFADLPYDICADDLRAALATLGTLCGREVTEDVIGEIFARFCVGK